MDAEQARALREPFLPAEIGKLPKPTKATNEKGRCDVCKGWHGLPAVHLDYVGHAACTDRLLKVDPEWNWRPMARGPNGEPLLVNGGLWIELTICGVTRPGFGDESNGKGMKEMIGDAIRNAAMRFGVALDLWTKEDLWSRQNESEGSGAADRMVGGPPGKAGVVEGAATVPATPAVTSNGEVDPSLIKMRGKLDVMVGKLRPNVITTAYLYEGFNRTPVPDADGEIHWAPLRDSLTKKEAHDLIDHLSSLEKQLVAEAPFE